MILILYLFHLQKGDTQVWHLIWSLQNKPEDVILKFFEIIYHDHSWIVDKIKANANDHSDETINFLDYLKSIQADFQNHTDFNVHRTKPVRLIWKKFWRKLYVCS